MLSLTRRSDRETAAGGVRRMAGALDGVGVGLFAAIAAWALVASSRAGGSALPGLALLSGCGLVLVAARTIASRARLVVPTAVFVAGVVVAARSSTGIFNSAPLSGPLRYVNADGAFFVQVAIAALMIAAIGRSVALRLCAVAGALFFAAVPFAIKASAAAWLVVVLPGASMVSTVAFGGAGARASIAFSGVLFLAALGATIWLGATYAPAAQPGVFERAAIQTVDSHRLVLWHDAFGIMRAHPLTGVGPRRYQVASAIARRDPDSRWAHNEFLQQGAEQGVAGLVLLAALFVWALGRLLLVRMPGAVAALGAASAGALGIHSTIDYVMHFPAIPLMAAALVGAAMAREGRAT